MNGNNSLPFSRQAKEIVKVYFAQLLANHDGLFIIYVAIDQFTYKETNDKKMFLLQKLKDILQQLVNTFTTHIDNCFHPCAHNIPFKSPIQLTINYTMSNCTKWMQMVHVHYLKKINLKTWSPYMMHYTTNFKQAWIVNFVFCMCINKE